MNRRQQFLILLRHMLANYFFIWVIPIVFLPQIIISIWTGATSTISTALPLLSMLPFVIAGQVVTPWISMPNSQNPAFLFQPGFLRAYAIDRSAITLSRLGLYWGTLTLMVILILATTLLRPDATLHVFDSSGMQTMKAFFPQATQPRANTLMIPGAMFLQVGVIATYLFLIATLSQGLAICTARRKGSGWIYWGIATLLFLFSTGLMLRLVGKSPLGLDGLMMIAFARYWPLLIPITVLLITAVNILTVRREQVTEYA